MKADNFVIAVGGRPKFPKEVSYLNISQSIYKVVTFSIPFPNIILNGWFIVDWDGVGFLVTPKQVLIISAAGCVFLCPWGRIEVILVRFVRGLVSIMRASKDAIVIVFFFVCLFFFSRPLPGQGFLKINSFLRAMKCLCWHAWFLEMLNFFFHFIHRLIGSKSFLCLFVRELFLCSNPLQYFLSRFLVP